MKNPSHFILSSATRAETILSGLVGELRYWHNYLELIYGGNKMPPTHPTRIRVESIFGEIISALNVGLKLEGDKRMTVVLSDDPKIGTTSNYYYSVPDHQVTSMMREEVFNRLAHIYTPSHLEGAKWKLDVVDSRFDMAFYIRGFRRIVITTGLIEQSCHSEADIAAILGHEVGHGVCSNSELQFFKLLTILVYSFSVKFSFVPIRIFQIWFTMREELMADYIGLMLMASAGYDPRLYPALMERRTRTDDDRKVFQQRRRGVMYYIKKLIIYLRNTSHPSDKTRIKCLEQVMGEAVTIYEQVRGAASTCG